MSRSDVAADSASHGEGHERHDVPPGLICPQCQSKLVRRSMRRTFKDRVLSMLGKWPYRCEMCNLRFSGPQDPASFARQHAPPPEEGNFDGEDSPEK